MPKIALDSNCTTYFSDALDPTYDPTNDISGLAPEKISLVRINFYTGIPYFILPSVKNENKKIRNLVKSMDHTKLAEILLDERSWDFEESKIDKLVREIFRFHSKLIDCKIVAEAQLSGMDFLLTCDKDMFTRFNKLSKHVSITICKPSIYLNSLNLPKGIKPKCQSPGLMHKTWWKL